MYTKHFLAYILKIVYVSIFLSYFQTEQEEWDNVRNLYERLLERTSHVKVWISFAKSEMNVPSDRALESARSIFHRANKNLCKCPEKEQRMMLLEAWHDFEKEYGDSESEEKVAKLLPKKVTKRRQITDEGSNQTRWEEYIDYIFPDDISVKPSLLLLAKAKEWAKKKEEQKEDLPGVSQEEIKQEGTSDDADLDKDDSDVEIGSTGSSSESENDDES